MIICTHVGTHAHGFRADDSTLAHAALRCVVCFGAFKSPPRRTHRRSTHTHTRAQAYAHALNYLDRIPVRIVAMSLSHVVQPQVASDALLVHVAVCLCAFLCSLLLLPLLPLCRNSETMNEEHDDVDAHEIVSRCVVLRRGCVRAHAHGNAKL